MILACDDLAVEWLDLADLVFGDGQPIDLAQVGFYCKLLASGPDDAHVAPPLVSPIRERPGRYRFRDGRHRALGHVFLGRTRIRCIVVTPPATSPTARQEISPCP